MKIKIGSLDSLSFTKREENFIKLLETDTFFESYILEARKLFAIPADPLNPTTKSKFNFDDIQAVYVAATFLVNAYLNLPNYWVTTFGMFIVTGTAYPPIMKDHNIINIYSEHEGKQGLPLKKEVKIIIGGFMTFNQLMQHLRKNKPFLDRILADLPKEPGMELENLNIKQRLHELRKSGLKHKDIGDLLKKEYGGQLPFPADYEMVAAEYSRFNKNRKKILRKSPDYEKSAHLKLKQIPKYARLLRLLASQNSDL